MTADQKRLNGLGLAGITAVVSGVAVFVNSYGVRRFPDATVYTTAKNLVAAACVATLLALARARRPTPDAISTLTPAQRRRLGAVAIIGGSVPFVLFFEGLARAGSTDAAFIHKTLVGWVALLAVIVLGERLTPAHLGAIALILIGQAEVRGGVGCPDLATGEGLILAATLCWAVEVVIAKRLLAELEPLVVGTARMAGGAVALVFWLMVSGRFDNLLGLGAHQIGWALLTGAILTAYVVSWHHALALAPATDVTAVLVFGALITAALNASVKGVPLAPQVAGLVLIAVGVVVVVGQTMARRLPVRRTPQAA
jgi:drug/metabolite transporter (DMT)-like permease